MTNRKVFEVQVELYIHAVSCPGVWLCPCGSVSLQIYMLDSCVQTANVEPVFPAVFEEKFVFCKAFEKPQQLKDLQRLLHKECLYVELIQWTDQEIGNVLATFITTLNEALFPAKIEGVYAGIDVDLLMEPAPAFPGIIAPKIEITTKTTIDECICKATQYNKSKTIVVNPKMIESNLKTRMPYLHQRKVCHSRDNPIKNPSGSTARAKRPPFIFRKADEKLLWRTPKGLDRRSGSIICKCRMSPQSDCKSSTNEFLQSRHSKVSVSQTTSKICNCGKKKKTACPVCDRYNNTFEETTCVCSSSKPKISYTDQSACKSLSKVVSLRPKETRSECLSERNCASYPPQKKNSIHFKTCTDMSSHGNRDEFTSSSVEDSCQCSPKLQTTGQFQRRFYDSLERFYDTLYNKTLERARHSRNICIC